MWEQGRALLKQMREIRTSLAFSNTNMPSCTGQTNSLAKANYNNLEVHLMLEVTLFGFV
jgi:hypothetical protein